MPPSSISPLLEETSRFWVSARELQLLVNTGKSLELGNLDLLLVKEHHTHSDFLHRALKGLSYTASHPRLELLFR